MWVTQTVSFVTPVTPVEFNNCQTQFDIGLHEGCKNFQEICEPSENSRAKKGEMQLVM